MRQLKLISEKHYPRRKTVRAISLRGANHVVLKAMRPILRRDSRLIRQIVRETQDRFEIKINAVAIMTDHAHFIVKVSSRRQFANSLRYLTGRIATQVAGSKLWRTRAWSRVLTWGRDLRIAERYVWRNSIKAGCFDLSDTAMIVDGVLQT